MYKEDLALNNLQWLICYKPQPNIIIYIWYIRIKKIWCKIRYLKQSSTLAITSRGLPHKISWSIDSNSFVNTFHNVIPLALKILT